MMGGAQPHPTGPSEARIQQQESPDDEADRDLLEHVNPILLSVLDARPR